MSAPEKSIQEAAETTPSPLGAAAQEDQLKLLNEWKLLRRTMTGISLLTSLGFFTFLNRAEGYSLATAALLSLFGVAAFRGAIELLAVKLFPRPSLYGLGEEHRAEDALHRRRHQTWRLIYRLVAFVLILCLIATLFNGKAPWDNFIAFFQAAPKVAQMLPVLGLQFTLLFLINFGILFGPLAGIGLMQVKAFEPGEADWGVKLDDVRGQAEAKEEVNKIVRLWQSGERFEKSGGKRERGLLFLGAPGTGKTMLAKAIATNFNCFAGSMLYLTRAGLKTFAETAGTTQQVLNKDREWVPAEIKSFGRQPVVEIDLRPGIRSKSNVVHTITATPDHRWLTTTRGLVTDLQVGDRVPFNPVPLDQPVEEAFIRGFGYGDGTIDGHGRAYVRLCGEKASFLPLFERYGHCSISTPPSCNGDPVVVFHAGHFEDWKQLPSTDRDAAWLASWFRGLAAADGNLNADQPTIELQDAEAIQYLIKLAPYAGYMVTGHCVKSNMETNFGLRSAPLEAITLRQEGEWRVTEIRDAGEAEVFCAVEPKTESFTLAHGILTGNCPFVTIPGTGFAQTFIGIDVVIVLFLVWRARRLARKWGGQCIIFIDEIDAVGMRRASLGGGMGRNSGTELGFDAGEILFYGQQGTLTPDGDLLHENAAWRERIFNARYEANKRPPHALARAAMKIQRFMVPGMGMGGMALNMLLVVMDGIGNPSMMRKLMVKRVNTFLDALFVIPQKIGPLPLRLKRAKPRNEQLFFIGATNVPLEALDPALIRPGRMGRHVWFRTPTFGDRKDIFDLYLSKVSHDPALDSDEARDELARITPGYSPAMIDQVCSIALTYAHSEEREFFGRPDVLEAMATIEAGMAVNIEYHKDDTRSVAIHEAGHAACAKLMGGDNRMSTRLSIRKRGDSLGHHTAMDIEERFVDWRDQKFAHLVWILGAMAAEHNFYGQHGTGVGGDIWAASVEASSIVAGAAMGPYPVRKKGASARLGVRQKAQEAELHERYQELGMRILRLASDSPYQGNDLAAAQRSKFKQQEIAELLGQAYAVAYRAIEKNKKGVEMIAERLIEEKEIYGNDLTELLEAAKLRMPKVDYTDPKFIPDLW